MISFRVTGLEEVKKQMGDFANQAAFGMSVGMNRTIDEAQIAIRQHLPESFTLRRKEFIERTIYRKPGEDFATKTKLTAALRINDERNVLAKFESGGDKVPQQGKFLAVPVGARPDKASIIPEALRIKALLFGMRSRLSQAVAIGGSGRRRTRNILLKRSGADDVFIKHGEVFKAVGTGRRRHLVLEYVFKKSVRITPSLHFEQIARATISDRAVPNIEGALNKLIDDTFHSFSAPSHSE